MKRLERGAFSPATEVAVADFLRQHTQDEDTLLVWGLSPGIYARSGLRPATKYVFHQMLLTDAPLSRRFLGLEDRRARFIERLRETPPAYIIVGVGDRNGFEPLDGVAEMARFPAFRDIVIGSYEPAKRIGNFFVYQRRVAAENLNLTSSTAVATSPF